MIAPEIPGHGNPTSDNHCACHEEEMPYPAISNPIPTTISTRPAPKTIPPRARSVMRSTCGGNLPEAIRSIRWRSLPSRRLRRGLRLLPTTPLRLGNHVCEVVSRHTAVLAYAGGRRAVRRCDEPAVGAAGYQTRTPWRAASSSGTPKCSATSHASKML